MIKMSHAAENETHAAKSSIGRALNMPADNMTIRDASIVGSRLLTALAILDGRMDIDSVSITLSQQTAEPTPTLAKL